MLSGVITGGGAAKGASKVTRRIDAMSASPQLLCTIDPQMEEDLNRVWVTCIAYDPDSDRLFVADNFNYKLKVSNYMHCSKLQTHPAFKWTLLAACAPLH
jgi:hypothetical protein